MQPSIISFSKAIQISEELKHRHLLLGNGFSIDWRKHTFHYGSLFEQADFSSLSKEVQQLFEALRTEDFEVVMMHLRNAAKTIRVYRPGSIRLIDKLEKDAEALKEVLIRTIASNHPEFPAEISEREYRHCREFLSHFQSGKIYSLNYDLLLYWVLMHFNGTEESLKSDDGFRTPDAGVAEYVSWDIENTNTQNIFHLHGALYLFDAGAVLKKYTWANTGIRLIEQVREALSENYFPLIVTEGESAEKQRKIMHSSYLSRGQRSISNISGSLFIHGHSLADSDNHIIKLLSKRGCKIQKLFVSLFGEANTPENKIIIDKAMQIQSSRGQRYPLELYFYNSESAHVWR